MGKFTDLDPLKGKKESDPKKGEKSSALVPQSFSAASITIKKEIDALLKRGSSVPMVLEKVREKFKKEAEKRKQSSGKILLLVDATESMTSFWQETARIIKDLIQRIEEVCGKESFWLKIVAYRDYCDGNMILEPSNWSNNSEELQRFVSQIRCFGGGDEPEAIEKALELANQEEKLGRVILIGDAPPHPENDYIQQAKELGKKQRPVFAFYITQSPSLPRTKPAFETIAQESGGLANPLNDAKEIIDLIGLIIVESVGGKEALEKYLKDFPLALTSTSAAKQLTRKLLLLKRGDK